MMTRAAAMTALLVFGAAAGGENRAPCEAVAEFRQFDFWIGDWEVTLPDGRRAGGNSIRREPGGCALLERWTSAGGGSGISINYYDPQDRSWHQHWVGGDGSIVNISGRLEDGDMVLGGTISYVGKEGVFPFRGRWSPRPDGSVRQFFEESRDGGATWKPWFEGIYSRAAN